RRATPSARRWSRQKTRAPSSRRPAPLRRARVRWSTSGNPSTLACLPCFPGRQCVPSRRGEWRMGGRGPADHGTSPADDVLARVERLRAEERDPADLGRACAELRESVLELAEGGRIALAEARRV